jgi:hypothetical protein
VFSTTQLTSEYDPQLEQTTLPPSTTQLTSEFDPQLEQTAPSQNETTIGSPLPIQNNEGLVSVPVYRSQTRKDSYRFQSTDLKQGKTTSGFRPSLLGEDLAPGPTMASVHYEPDVGEAGPSNAP